MINKSYLKNKMGAMLERLGLIPKQRAAIFSHWTCEHFRPHPETGVLELLSTETIHNLVVDEGLNDILDVYFKDGDKKSLWYVCIFNNDYTVLAANDYGAKGFTESTAYTEGTRPAWTGSAVSGKSTDNSASKATFTMDAPETIYGAALVGGTDAATKNNSTDPGTPIPNKMYCSAQFSASKSVVTDDVLKVTVTLTSSSVV